VNKVETYASENRNTVAIKFTRPAIQLAIRHYRRLEKFGDLIRRQVEPKIQALRLAQSRIDEIEADHDLLETLKQANRRKTDGERNSTPNDKYRTVYAIGKLDTTDLAAENDTLTGAILSKS
jgi:hypothetical protein